MAWYCTQCTSFFANSSLFFDATAKRILHGDNRTIQGCEIPLLLVADSAYPLLPWLLKPFANHGSLTQDQKNFFLMQGLFLRMLLGD